MARKRTLFRRILRGFTGLLGIAIIGGTAWLATLNRSTNKDLEALRKQGVPTSIEEFKQGLPHEGRSGESAYLTAFKAWNGLTPEQRKTLQDLPTLLDQNAVKKDQATSEVLSQMTKLFRRAASTDWNDFLARSGQPPTSQEVKNLNAHLDATISLLSQSAVFKAHRESPVDAFNEVLYADRVASNHSRAALGAKDIVGVLRQEKTVLDAWRKALAAGPSDPTYLRTADRILNSFAPLPDLEHILRSEFVDGLAINDHLSSFQNAEGVKAPEGTQEKLMWQIQRSLPAKYVRESHYVSAWKTAFSQLPKDPFDWQGYLHAVHKAFADSPKWKGIDGWNGMATLDPVIVEWTRRLAERRMAGTAVAAMSQKLLTGKLPPHAPILGEQSTDPFSGKPFGYRTSSKGFVIYSVDADGRDDEGKPKGEKDQTGDIAQRYAA